MNWSDIADTVGKVAPVLGAALLGDAKGAIGSAISAVMGTPNDPQSVKEAIDRRPDLAVKLKELEIGLQRSLVEAQASQRKAELEAQTEQGRAINTTMQEELRADNGYRAGWRPLIGYVMALSFLMLAAAMAWGVFAEPSQLPTMMDGIVTLIVAMGAVLGVNINARSKEKHTAMTGKEPVSFLDSIVKSRR